MDWTVFALVVPSIMVGLFGVLGCWLGFQLVHQNGRLLFRLEVVEQRVRPIGIQSSGAPGTHTKDGCGYLIAAQGPIASSRVMAGDRTGRESRVPHPPTSWVPATSWVPGPKRNGGAAGTLAPDLYLAGEGSSIDGAHERFVLNE